MIRGVSRPEANVVLSIVSHGQGHTVAPLLRDLADWCLPQTRVVLTLNIPEDERFLDEATDLPLQIIRNGRPLGFGANHNQAFMRAPADYFCVVNPDIRLHKYRQDVLIDALSDGQLGALAPLVLSPTGDVEDSARRFPTVSGLAKRLWQERRRNDYDLCAGLNIVDWVAGMFVMYRGDAFRAVGGFDERFFMYMEDVDICVRLAAKGWKTGLHGGSCVVHDAQRASQRSIRHMIWHMQSAGKFLFRNRQSASRRAHEPVSVSKQRRDFT